MLSSAKHALRSNEHADHAIADDSFDARQREAEPDFGHSEHDVDDAMVDGSQADSDDRQLLGASRNIGAQMTSRRSISHTTDALT